MANTTSSGSTDSTATPPRPRPSVIPESAAINAHGGPSTGGGCSLKDQPPEGDTTTNEEATEEDEAEEGRKEEESLHPEWLDEIRFMSYRTAAKLRLLQKRTGLVQIDIWNMIEAFRENGLNVADAETKISRPRLETLVSSLYASLSKRLPSSSTDHHHQGGGVAGSVGGGGTRPKLESMASWLLSWLLTALNPSQNDRNLQLKIRTLKTSLAVLCSGKLMDKLRYVYSLMSDENGHLVHAKYASFVRDVVRIPRAVGEEYKVSSSSTGLGGGQQPGVGGATSPFEAGSQVTLNDFLEALMSDPGPQCLSWLPVLHRIVAAESVVHQGMSCGSCGVKAFRGLRYKSDKSKNFHLCQWCFWRGRIPLEHRDDVFKEFNTFSKSSLSTYGGGSLKKSLQCLSGSGKTKTPKFPEMEAPLDLGGMVQSSPLPSVRSLPRNPPPYSQQQQSEADFHSYGNICQQQQQHQSHSADDPNSSIIEHHLIAQYAQELHQGGGGSSTGGGDGGSYINTAPDPGGHMLQQSRELVYELEKKNQEIMHDIERLRRSHPAKENKARGGGGTMSELQGLRSHKMELESRLDELQCARRDLMEELDELMKLLKVQPMPPQPQQQQVTSQQPHQIHHQNHFQQQFHEVTQPHYHIQQIQPGQQVLSGGKGAVVGPHQQPQQAHLLTADPSVSAAETNHSYTNIAGIVGIEQQQHSARVMPPDYPLYEVPYQDQQVPANYQYSTSHYQQQHEDQSVYYESHYSEVSRPPVIGGSDPPPTITSAAGSNAGSRPSGGLKEKKQHGVKRMSTKRLEKSKAVEMDYENDVAPVATAVDNIHCASGDAGHPRTNSRTASAVSSSD